MGNLMINYTHKHMIWYYISWIFVKNDTNSWVIWHIDCLSRSWAGLVIAHHLLQVNLMKLILEAISIMWKYLMTGQMSGKSILSIWNLAIKLPLDHMVTCKLMSILILVWIFNSVDSSNSIGSGTKVYIVVRKLL